MFWMTLLDDDDFRVRTRFLLPGMRITLKVRGLTRRVGKPERLWLLSACEELQRLGAPIAPGSPLLEELLHEFASAVWGGDLRWRAFFSQPPEAVAADIVRYG